MYSETDLDKMYRNTAPPDREPERQYYFIEACRKKVWEESERLGRPLTFCVTTFGCQMNARDSEKLTGILEQAGYQKKYIAVERNGEIVPKAQYGAVTLEDGDTLEVVRFVGGG